jgi:hypothetical protein
MTIVLKLLFAAWRPSRLRGEPSFQRAPRSLPGSRIFFTSGQTHRCLVSESRLKPDALPTFRIARGIRLRRDPNFEFRTWRVASSTGSESIAPEVPREKARKLAFRGLNRQLNYPTLCAKPSTKF